MRLRSLAASVAALSMALPLTIAADGDDTVASAGFDTVDVAVVGGDIVVEGVATFGGEALVVGEDATTDAVPPGTGADLSRLEISQDPESGDMVFRMVVADMLAGAAAPGLVWGWALGGSSLNTPELFAFSTDGSGAPGTFQFVLGTGGGVNEDFSVAAVGGEFDGEALVWRAAPSTFGLEHGAKVTAGHTPVRSTTGISALGATGVFGTTLDDMLVDGTFAVGGGAEVKVLNAAGDEIAEEDARVRRGAFSAVIEDLEPGTYTVVVSTAYGDATAIETFTVTI